MTRRTAAPAAIANGALEATCCCSWTPSQNVYGAAPEKICIGSVIEEIELASDFDTGEGEANQNDSSGDCRQPVHGKQGAARGQRRRAKVNAGIEECC
jgi:hypothetical protein